MVGAFDDPPFEADAEVVVVVAVVVGAVAVADAALVVTSFAAEAMVSRHKNGSAQRVVVVVESKERVRLVWGDWSGN